jgi:Calpain family cysteine protease
VRERSARNARGGPVDGGSIQAPGAAEHLERGATSMNTATIDSFRRQTDFVGDSDSEAPPASDAGSQLAEGASARARYEAFVSAEPGNPEPCIDNRLLDGPLPPAVLFGKEGNDVDEVDMADVQQGKLGDCYLMATLAGLARTPEGRAVIRNAIVENTNDAGQVVSYTVTLHKPQSTWMSTTFTSVRVTVDGTSFGCNHARPREAADHTYRETWPLVIEEAFAQTFGGYEAIGQGGYAAPAMEVLTGNPAIHHTWVSHYSVNALASDVSSGKIVVFGTACHGVMDNITPGHAYVVTATAYENGKFMVTLHNPWGDKRDLVVPYDDVRNSVSFIDVGSAR